MNTQKKILFLWEDDEDFIKMFSLFLREHSYSTESIKSFDECIESCKSNPPTLLIIRSFVNEPRDGLRFIRELKSDSSISYFPIVVGWADFTNYNREQGYKEAFEAGANACFVYPFDITDVLKQIEVLLNNPTATEIVDR